MNQDVQLSSRALELLESLRRRHDDPSIPSLPPGRSVDELPEPLSSQTSAALEEQIASDLFMDQGPRFLRRVAGKQGFFERLNARSTKSVYKRETRGGYALGLTMRVLLFFSVIGGSVYGNLFFLEPETKRFINERKQGEQARRQIPGFQNQLKQLKVQLQTVETELKSKTELFSSREFFRARISEFLFELESSGGRITTLCIGRLKPKGALDPCNSEPEQPNNGNKKANAKAAPAPKKGSGQQFSQVYSGFLGNPFELAKDAIKIDEIARLDPSFGTVGVDGVILELEGNSESYFLARQSLVRDIPAIVLLSENIKYLGPDSNAEKIQLVFSYPYSGD